MWRQCDSWIWAYLLVIHKVKLTKSKVMPLIESALKNESDYVRGHANSAAADVEWFFKMEITKTKVRGSR